MFTIFLIPILILVIEAFWYFIVLLGKMVAMATENEIFDWQYGPI